MQEGFVLNGPMSSFLVLQVVVFALDIVGRHTCMHITHHNKEGSHCKFSAIMFQNRTSSYCRKLYLQ